MNSARLGVVLFLGAPLVLVRCVGDSTTPPPDAATDATTSDASNDVAPSDSGGDVASDAGSDVNCQPTPPLFQPNGKGPFCVGAVTGNHCNLGEHCCMNTATNVNSCAASCDGGVLDIACYSVTECGDAGLVCCGRGVVEMNVCPYPVVANFGGTACESLCSNEFVSCANTGECGTKTCVPVRALNEAGTTTTNITTGACL